MAAPLVRRSATPALRQALAATASAPSVRAAFSTAQVAQSEPPKGKGILGVRAPSLGRIGKLAC
jgi:hypothetical protein